MSLAKKLKLKRDICFFDLETTGIQTDKARIVEISITRISVKGKITRFDMLVNPVIKIPKEATAVHNIKDSDVVDSPTFSDIADDVLAFIKDSDLAGYNIINYDVPILMEEFRRAHVPFVHFHYNFIDVCNIFKRYEGRTLADAHRFYVGTEMENAHKASVDVEATIAVFEGQIDRYPELAEADIEAIAIFSNYDKKSLDSGGFFTYGYGPDANKIYFAKGKHKGQLATSEISYLFWIVGNETMEADTKEMARSLIDSYDLKKRAEKGL